MSKTITVRLDETENKAIVDDAEMTEIMAYSDELQKGLADISAGRYTIIDVGARKDAYK